MILTLTLAYLLNLFSVQFAQQRQERRRSTQTQIKVQTKMDTTKIRKSESEWK